MNTRACAGDRRLSPAAAGAKASLRDQKARKIKANLVKPESVQTTTNSVDGLAASSKIKSTLHLGSELHY